jgi:tRNA nucleotidyltransferase/poly(A) polymerase
VGGYKDLRARKIKPIIPLVIFKEDPERIVRCIKNGVSAGFLIPFSLKRAIRRDSRLLADVSPSRMTEEFFKILASGKAEDVFRALVEFRILHYFVPSVWARMREDIAYANRLFADLNSLDKQKLELENTIAENESQIKARVENPGLFRELSYFLKSFHSPMRERRGFGGEVQESLLAPGPLFSP